MAKVNAPVYIGQTLYTPDGPDVAEEHLPLLGDHLFDKGKPDVDEHAGETLQERADRLKAELDEVLALLQQENDDQAKATAQAEADAEKARAEADAAKEQTGGTPVERPDGRAGTEKWLEYAQAQGITVPDGSREDKAAIRTLVEEHEKSQG